MHKVFGFPIYSKYILHEIAKSAVVYYNVDIGSAWPD